MNDFDDLETRVRKYQPAGPPADLRVRALAAPSRGRVGSWMLAAAACAIAMLLYGLASRAYGRMTDEVTSGHRAARFARIEAWTTLLGGDADARNAAERIVAGEDGRAATENASGTGAGR